MKAKQSFEGPKGIFLQIATTSRLLLEQTSEGLDETLVVTHYCKNWLDICESSQMQKAESHTLEQSQRKVNGSNQKMNAAHAHYSQLPLRPHVGAPWCMSEE